MKKILLLFVLFLIAAALPAQRFNGGIAVGIAGTQVAGDTYSGYRKAGIFAGFWVQYPVNPKLSLQTELAYFQKGSRHNPDEKHNDMTFYLMRLGYIEMPFFAQLYLNSGFAIEAGPSFGILLHSHEELDYLEVTYGKFTLINPSFTAGFMYKLNDTWSMHFRAASSVISIRADKVNGARRRFFDQGQYSDALTLTMFYGF